MAVPSRTARIALITALILQAALLTACGSGDAGGSTATASATGTAGATGSSTPGSTSTAASTLSGDGSATIATGSAYSFTPAVGSTASTLTFSIVNKPSWATFSVSTGQLSGTPSVADVGSYANITISATNGKTSASLPAFTITVAANAASTGMVTLSWTPPTHNTDGTSLSDLSGYFIYYGSSPAALSNKVQVTNPDLTAYTISGLGTGTTYFAISAYAANGAESALSNVGSKTI